MYGRVSYKKQFVLGILLLIVLLGVVEVFANVWLYNVYRCEFEDNEIFKNTDSEMNRKICIESLDFDFNERVEKDRRTYHQAKKAWDESIMYINSEGFRSPEFSKEKPENTYRIFIMGGSTSFGAGVLDHQTFPFYLQQKYDQLNLNFSVEIINTGWPNWWSLPETNLIKNRLLNYEPDLFIVFDGFNDINHGTHRDNPLATPPHWKDRWAEICDLGRQNGFDTILTIQPILGSGEKKLTEQEYQAYVEKNRSLNFKLYSEYVEKLDELKNNCTLTADLRGLFDNIKEPIYYDRAHTGYRGNQIIAEKMFELSLPIVMEKARYNDSTSINKNPIENFDNLPTSNLSDTIFDKTLDFVEEVISPYKTPKVSSLIFS